MGVRVGELKQVIKFEKNNPTDEEGGGEADGFIEFLTTRGKLRRLSGNRGLEAGAVLLSSSYELTVRFQQALANELYSDVTVRVVAGNRFYTIDGYDEEDQEQRFYIFRLSEQSRD